MSKAHDRVEGNHVEVGFCGCLGKRKSIDAMCMSIYREVGFCGWLGKSVDSLLARVWKAKYFPNESFMSSNWVIR